MIVYLGFSNHHFTLGKLYPLLNSPVTQEIFWKLLCDDGTMIAISRRDLHFTPVVLE